MIKTDKNTLHSYRKKVAKNGEIIGDNDGQKYGENLLAATPFADEPKEKKER